MKDAPFDAEFATSRAVLFLHKIRSPASGSYRQSSILTRVDFPHPLRPVRATNAPLGISRLKSLRTSGD